MKNFRLIKNKYTFNLAGHFHLVVVYIHPDGPQFWLIFNFQGTVLISLISFRYKLLGLHILVEWVLKGTAVDCSRHTHVYKDS